MSSTHFVQYTLCTVHTMYSTHFVQYTLCALHTKILQCRYTKAGTKCAFPLSISTIQITQSPNFTRKLPTDVCEFKKIGQLRLSLPADRN